MKRRIERNRIVLVAMVIVILSLGIEGCEEAFFKGVATGVGASQATTEATELAKEAKTVLVAEILRLRQELEKTPAPEEKASLEARIAVLQKQQDIATITEAVLNKVGQGVQRNWSTEDPQEKQANYNWLIETIVALGLTGYGLNERNNKLKLQNAATDSRIAALENKT